MRACTFLLLGVRLLAQQPNADSTLEGSVVNALTGRPIRQAQIQALGPSRVTATSDEQGRWRIPSVSAGPYQLLPKHPSFPQGVFAGAMASAVFVTVAAGEIKRDVLIRPSPPGAVAGKIIDPDGDPIRNCQVRLFAMLYQRGTPRLVATGYGTSNDLGEYRIFHVEPGEYYLGAQCRPRVLAPKPSGLPSASSMMQSDHLQFYPQATDLGGATRLQVQSGADLQGYDLRLRNVNVTTLKGLVVFPPDVPSGPVQITVSPTDLALRSIGPVASTSVPASSSGRWSLQGLAPGDYQVTASSGSEESLLVGRQPIVIGDTAPPDLLLDLTPAAEVKGQVIREQSNSEPSASEAIQVSLLPLEPGPTLGRGFARLNSDGTFKMAGVSPGDYELFLATQGSTFIKAASLNGQAVSPSRVSIPGGPTSLEIVTGIRTGTVEGIVESCNLGALVVLLPDGQNKEATALRRIGMVGPGGNFKLNNVPPGTYRLGAFANLAGSTIEHPGVRAAMESEGEVLTIREGETLNKQPRLVTLQK